MEIQMPTSKKIFALMVKFQPSGPRISRSIKITLEYRQTHWEKLMTCITWEITQEQFIWTSMGSNKLPSTIVWVIWLLSICATQQVQDSMIRLSTESNGLSTQVVWLNSRTPSLNLISIFLTAATHQKRISWSETSSLIQNNHWFKILSHSWK